MMSTEGKEAIIWIQSRAAVERGQSQAWLRKRVNEVRKDLGLPTRHGELMVSLRESTAAFQRSMERMMRSLGERRP